MSKKHFITLANTIRCNNDRRAAAGLPPMFDAAALEVLADFCAGWNSKFNQIRWLDYIAGKCGPNGGSK